MTTSSYLAQSVEAARLASAQAQMSPEPWQLPPVEARACYRVFEFTVPYPHYVEPLRCPVKSAHSGLRFIIFIYPHTDPGKYIVHAKPIASLAAVQLEFEQQILPF